MKVHADKKKEVWGELHGIRDQCKEKETEIDKVRSVLDEAREDQTELREELDKMGEEIDEIGKKLNAVYEEKD